MKNFLKTLTICMMCLFIMSCDNDDEVISEITVVTTVVRKLEEGRLLNALYSVSDFISEDYANNKGVTFTWWRANNEEGTSAVMISNANETSYTLTSEDINKYIAVEVAVEGTINMKERSRFVGPIIGNTTSPAGLVSAIDTQLFKQIKVIGDIFSKDNIWKGYNFREIPMYLIHKNSAGKADRGYVINPKSSISDATEITGTDNAGIKVYRYDTQMEKALGILNSEDGNGIYDFKYEIDGNKSYYLQVYTDAEVKAGEQLATYPGGFFNPADYTLGSIDFIIHEIFHEYQETWKFIGGLSTSHTKEVIELRALIHQIFKDFPNDTNDKTVVENKLRQFVAIRAKEKALTGRDVASYGEKLEGTARFVEKMALRKAFPARAKEPFITGTVVENDYGITSKELLGRVIENLQYEIGASVQLALNKLSPTVTSDIEKGKTQYQAAKDFFNMTQPELDQQFENAKNSVNWSAVQNKVKEWSKLK